MIQVIYLLAQVDPREPIWISHQFKYSSDEDNEDNEENLVKIIADGIRIMVKRIFIRHAEVRYLNALNWWIANGRLAIARSVESIERGSECFQLRYMTHYEKDSSFLQLWTSQPKLHVRSLLLVCLKLQYRWWAHERMHPVVFGSLDKAVLFPSNCNTTRDLGTENQYHDSSCLDWNEPMLPLIIKDWNVDWGLMSAWLWGEVTFAIRDPGTWLLGYKAQVLLSRNCKYEIQSGIIFTLESNATAVRTTGTLRASMPIVTSRPRPS